MSPRYRTALVTGASSGLGRALAKQLSSQGTRVVLCSRRKSVLDEVAAELNGPSPIVCAFDLHDTDQAVAKIREADDRIGGLELIIANAGIAITHPPADQRWEDLSSMLRLNFEAAAATLLAVLPEMKKRGAGHLVGISSLAAYVPVPGSASYCASKAGFSSFQ